MARHTASKLKTALVLGLLCALPSGAFSAPRQADVEAPPSVLAIKLSPASFPSRKRRQVRRTPRPPSPSRRKPRTPRLDLQDPPPSTIDKTVQDAQANDPTYQPPQVFRLVQSPPSSLTLRPIDVNLLTYGVKGVDLDGAVVRPGETEAREWMRRGGGGGVGWFREEGAILVGAGSAGVPRGRTVWSDYGGSVVVRGDVGGGADCGGAGVEYVCRGC